MLYFIVFNYKDVKVILYFIYSNSFLGSFLGIKELESIQDKEGFKEETIWGNIVAKEDMHNFIHNLLLKIPINEFMLYWMGFKQLLDDN